MGLVEGKVRVPSFVSDVLDACASEVEEMSSSGEANEEEGWDAIV